jgi:hypothetical protein
VVRNSENFDSPKEPQAADMARDRAVTNDIVPRELDAIAQAVAAEKTQEENAQHVSSRVHAAREEAEMKAAIVLAKRFPRDESDAYTRIMRACDRPTFAESANYAFPRGGQAVTGPSVDLARELARIWGNIRYGMRIVSEDDERVHLKGYAYDLESNTYVESEDKFAKLVQRRNRVTRQSEWVRADERDLRELVNKRGAICVRNAILQLLPSDIVQDAMARSRDTTQKVARGEIQQDREQAIRRLALAFHDIGVSGEMIANYLKHPMELITNEEIADLRAIYKSIRDGNSRREEYFRMPAYTSSRAEFRQGGNGDRQPEQRSQPQATQPSQPGAPAPQAESPTQPAEQSRTESDQKRRRTAQNDPALETAKQNMQHVLRLAKGKEAAKAAEPAADNESPAWERLARQAAEHWETEDYPAALRRLNKESVTKHGVPLKRLAGEKLAELETRIASGEIALQE